MKLFEFNKRSVQGGCLKRVGACAQVRPALCGLFILVSGLLAGQALANPLDLFGAGSKNIAMGGTGTATADSYEATYYNPAALGLMENLEFGGAVSVYRPWLTAKYNSLDKDSGIISPVSSRRFDRSQVYFDVGLAGPIPLGKDLGKHLFMGLHVQIPADVLYSVKALPATEPVFPQYEARNRRLVFNAAISGRYKWVMLGVGFSILPTVSGSVKVDLADQQPSNSVEIDVGVSVSPNVGLLFEPIKGLTLGLSWRGAGQTRIDLPVDATVSSSMNPIFLSINAVTFWTPNEISFGVGWKAKRYALSTDIVYYMYSGFKMASPEVAVYPDSERTNLISSSEVPDAGLRDTVAVRLGGEFSVIPCVALRAGASWSQSPISVQSGDTNLLGGDQFSGSFGIGFDAAKMGGPKIKLDAHFKAGAVLDNTDAKSALNPYNPGYPSIGGGGWFLNSGVSLRFGF